MPEVGELVARAKSGDQQAFLQLFRQHRRDVARLIYRMQNTQTDLEDLVQDVFLQVHRSLKDFKGQSKFSTWLYRITVNVVLMNRRAKKSRPRYTDIDDVVDPHDDRPLPDEQTARRTRARKFYALIDQLSDKKREVYILHELEGVAPKDIAVIVDAPVLTVRTRLFYARQELLELLESEPSLKAVAAEFAKKPKRGKRGSKQSSAKERSGRRKL